MPAIVFGNFWLVLVLLVMLLSFLQAARTDVLDCLELLLIKRAEGEVRPVGRAMPMLRPRGASVSGADAAQASASCNSAISNSDNSLGGQTTLSGQVTGGLGKAMI